MVQWQAVPPSFFFKGKGFQNEPIGKMFAEPILSRLSLAIEMVLLSTKLMRQVVPAWTSQNEWACRTGGLECVQGTLNGQGVRYAGPYVIMWLLTT